ncbi:MAG: sodium-dependent bicarbonate transport family permease [Sedimenticolaceae bacterium]
MDTSLLANFIDPAILFFFFGVFAAGIRSNLEIPGSIAKFFSLYLLVAIGFKGGVALAGSGLDATALAGIGAAMFMALLVPAYSFLILRRRAEPFDAAAIAATYGSISAVTFIAAQQFLTRNDVDFGGHMTVAMVLMESPAIIMAVLLASYVRSSTALKLSPSVGAAAVTPRPVSLKAVLHEAFTDGAHLLLIGSLLIGYLTGEAGKEMMAPFTADIFKGILAFFLLEMGLLVARQLREARGMPPFLIGFALVMPSVNALIAIILASLLGMGVGDALLLAVLSASGSYIVVPAICRYAIPEASPGRYFTMSLGFTFPFNIIVGIPLYYFVIQALWS